MYSRWVLSISDLTSDWIRPLSSRISIWRARKFETSFRRSVTSTVSSSSWRCSVVMSGLYATMSASSPGSVMLRAATAASGGTGAPFATYCSIWAWTVRISAWTSSPAGAWSVSSSTMPRRYGSVPGEPMEAEAGLALDDRPDGPVLELDDLGDLRQRADLVELGRVVDVLLLGLALGDEGDRAAIRRPRR